MNVKRSDIALRNPFPHIAYDYSADNKRHRTEGVRHLTKRYSTVNDGSCQIQTLGVIQYRAAGRGEARRTEEIFSCVRVLIVIDIRTVRRDSSQKSGGRFEHPPSKRRWIVLRVADELNEVFTINVERFLG
jgi:hypothetical protein